MAELKGKKISFIGGGNMAQALISGLIGRGINPSNITVADPSEAIRDQLKQRKINAVDPTANTETDNSQVAVKGADVVVLAVKPQVMRQVVSDFAEVLDRQLVISVAAGLSTESLSKMLGGYKNIVRAMPNTPAMIQKGATGLYAADYITEADKTLAASLMSASGLVSWVEKEEQLHAVTAVSGSAPAYFFYMLESMIDAAVEQGLDSKQAAALAMQTALGAAQMAITSEEAPAELRRKVTSPNGTTQAAIESLQQDNFAQVMKKAMQACYTRSEEISNELAD
ncbi:pyrroline-5-carboxylate reductase [Psychrobacter piechaudii]|uniref:Pyrroline-5-carboxylate reductase n=1 Tax=Psychrobacter piechaudii TaxID=1945521 RepID=A0A1R4GF20_9GAMM|nr:pyrroline-5-carboxylate reductase [Psychrobacter piechaudii]SJM66766.1 Pyrroline-5-carboxylate reductase [Psychrobacter piechaudii]